MLYQKALEIIKNFEECRLEAYLDSGKPPVATIGYGSTRYLDGSPVKIGDKITQEQAEDLLIKYCEKMEYNIRASIKFPSLLSENQMNAICSWTYNIGDSAEAHSTLIRKLNLLSPLIENPKAWMDVGDEFLKWNHDNGVVVPGLTNRREQERALFLS